MYGNKILGRLTTALSSAGFLITKFSYEPEADDQIKLQLRSCNPEDKGKTKAEHSKDDPLTDYGKGERNIGEICDLSRFLGAQDWRDAFALVQETIRVGQTTAFNNGDFIRCVFDVPEAEHQGVKFKALHVDANVIIVDIKENARVLFNFDEIIFRSAINAKDANEGGFYKSALADYLNNEFSDALGLSDVLLPNHKGKNISLLTAYELFGDEEYWENDCNFTEEPQQIEYFSHIKNRIKVFEDDTSWYWTGSKRASSAAYFCYCISSGFSIYSGASSVGGVAPAFCVA